MSRESAQGILFAGAVICVACIWLYVAQADTSGQCQTFLGQLGAAFSPDIQQKCEMAKNLRTLGSLLGALGAAAGVLAGFKLLASSAIAGQ